MKATCVGFWMDPDFDYEQGVEYEVWWVARCDDDGEPVVGEHRFGSHDAAIDFADAMGKRWGLPVVQLD